MAAGSLQLAPAQPTSAHRKTGRPAPDTADYFTNGLPKWASAYIMYIKTEADPAGTQRWMIEQQAWIRELRRKVAELNGVSF